LKYLSTQAGNNAIYFTQLVLQVSKRNAQGLLQGGAKKVELWSTNWVTKSNEAKRLTTKHQRLSPLSHGIYSRSAVIFH